MYGPICGYGSQIRKIIWNCLSSSCRVEIYACPPSNFRLLRGQIDILCLSSTDMTADTALSLDGTGRLDYSLKQGPKRDILLRHSLQGLTSDPTGPSSMEVKFRTRSKSGTLLHVQENSNYTTIKVRGRKVITECMLT